MRTFSLRDLFWLILLSAVITGWYAHVQRHRTQRAERYREFGKMANENDAREIELRRAELSNVQEQQAVVRNELKQVWQQTENLMGKTRERESATVSVSRDDESK